MRSRRADVPSLAALPRRHRGKASVPRRFVPALRSDSIRRAPRLRRSRRGRPRRRAARLVRRGIGVGLLVLASLHHGDVTRSERALFDLFNTLPNGLGSAFRALYRLGALWAVGLVVVAALVRGRRRLAR